MKIISFISVAICLWSCEEDKCNHHSLENINPPYEINAALTTPEGIRVDTSGQDVSLEMIDRVVDATERCINDTFPDRLPASITDASWCEKEYKHHIDRDCITIKIPNSWSYSCDGTQLLLDRKVDNQLCIDKGLDRDFNECPCQWRSGIQEDNVIVVLPDLYMLPDPIVRYMTSCYNAWIGDLAKCAAPKTAALTGEWVGE
jgi:hypothetical protein